MCQRIGLFLETFLTSELVLAVFMLAVEKHKSTFLAPVGIGLTLFSTHLVGVCYTGAGLNPARSLGPDVVVRSFASYHWIYCMFVALRLGLILRGVGPGLGASIATGFYLMLKLLSYEKVNGKQDRDDTIICDIMQHSSPENVTVPNIDEEPAVWFGQ